MHQLRKGTPNGTTWKNLAELRAGLMHLLEREQTRMLRICAALERTADELPAAQPQRALKLLDLAQRAFSLHIFLHERCLFPLMSSCVSDPRTVEPIQRQLTHEHSADQGLIVEIVENLEAPAANKPVDMETLGYILRSFFDNYRRHACWERTVLYPMAHNMLPSALPVTRGLGRIGLATDEIELVLQRKKDGSA